MAKICYTNQLIWKTLNTKLVENNAMILDFLYFLISKKKKFLILKQDNTWHGYKTFFKVPVSLW